MSERPWQATPAAPLQPLCCPRGPHAPTCLWAFDAVRRRRAPQVAVRLQVGEAPDLPPVEDLLPARKTTDEAEGEEARQELAAP